MRWNTMRAEPYFFDFKVFTSYVFTTMFEENNRARITADIGGYSIGLRVNNKKCIRDYSDSSGQFQTRKDFFICKYSSTGISH